jgi:hypothetical protein
MVVLGIGYILVLLTQVQTPVAPELPRFREKLGALKQVFGRSHPEVQRQSKIISELERNPSSLVGGWAQTKISAVWEFHDDGSVLISSLKTGITTGTWRSVTRNLIHLNFGSTNTLTGFAYTKVIDGKLTLFDTAGKKSVFSERQ